MDVVRLLTEAQAGNRLVSLHEDPDNLNTCSVGFVDAVSAVHVRLHSVTTSGRILGFQVRRLESLLKVETGGPYLTRVEALIRRDTDVFEEVHAPASGGGDLIRELVEVARDQQRVATICRFSGDDATGYISATTDLRATVELIDRFGERAGTAEVPWRDVECVDFGTEEEQITRFLSAPESARASSGEKRGKDRDRKQIGCKDAPPGQEKQEKAGQSGSGRNAVRLLTQAQAENRLVSLHADPDDLDTCWVGFVDAVSATHIRLRSVTEEGRILGFEAHRLKGVCQVRVGDPYLLRVEALAGRDGDVFEKVPSPAGEGRDLIRESVETARDRRRVASLFLFSGDEITGRIAATTDHRAMVEPIDQCGNISRAVSVPWKDIAGMNFETTEEQTRRFLSAQPNHPQA